MRLVGSPANHTMKTLQVNETFIIGSEGKYLICV